jgi:hypothetical protein
MDVGSKAHGQVVFHDHCAAMIESWYTLSQSISATVM